MDNMFFLLHEIDKGELSEDDLAVLQAFEAMENKSSAPLKVSTAQSADPVFAASVAHLTSAVGEDMLTIFAAEAEEDITSMQYVLENLQQGDHVNPSHLMRIKRLGHKLRGTAGAVDFPVMATIASHIEVIAEQVSEEKIYPLAGLYVLAQAITVLKRYLCEIRSHGKEPEDALFLQELDATYKNLNIGLHLLSEKQNIHLNIITDRNVHLDILTSCQDGENMQDEKKVSARITAPFLREIGTETLHYPHEHACIDVKHFEKHSQRIGQLVELCSSLEDAVEEAQMALQDLNIAQTRLQHLEPKLALFLTSSTLSKEFGVSISSSLITRILSEARQKRGSTLSFHKSRLCTVTPTASTCDELERYGEKDLLIRSLQEAIADVSLTTARLQATHTRLAMVQQAYLSHVAALRNTTLEMCRIPLYILMQHLRHIIAMNTLAQAQHVQFEVTGEGTEIDQDILAALALPLIQLMHTCITEIVVGIDSTEHDKEKLSRIWMHIQETDSEIIIEIGFSMTIQAGAIESIEGVIQRLNGKLALQPNGDGGLSIFLHIPRVQGAVRCLLVRVSLQKLVIPFSQIQRIVERQRVFDKIYHLRDLLGFPSPVAAISVEHTQSVLVVQKAECGQIGIAVDEIVGEIDLFVKPLKFYLQRPGLIGTAIDGKGRVILMVDLHSLMRHSTHSMLLSSNRG